MRRSAPIALVALGLWLASSFADAPGPVLVVHLKPAVTVVDPWITIADVAALADGSAKLHEAVARLDLVELVTSEATIISREQIALRIQLAGFDQGSFRVSGASQAEVVLDRSQVTEASLVAAARQAVRRKLSAKAQGGSLRLLRPVTLPQLAMKKGDHIYVAANWSGLIEDHGLAEIEVAVTINGKRQATVPVLLDVGVATPATHQKVAHRVPQDVPPAKTIQSAALKEPAPRAVKAVKDDLPGLVVSRTDRTAPAAENPIVVRARESVKLIAQAGALRVTATGEALQEGRAGQTIRVRNIDSNKTVLGKVVESGLVEIDF